MHRKNGHRQNADELLARMEAVRGRLDYDARVAKQSVQEMTDWRNAVRKNPLIAVGAAAVLGNLLVPKKQSIPTLKKSDV